ncbi:(2Fe-2S) ferredoxin domain-containing protein [Geminocystis sp. CENA526]|uniref:(2Fe-2S) ferredoxin domain-containing protein n=1 Tax=Geminocystis sp. CENA526 TaxID=1355871 RepID=UPI003D6F80C8
MLTESVKKLGLSHIQRHIFLCCDQAKPKCCSHEDSMKSWQYLKTRLKELNLDHPTPENPHCVFRTKADCLRVCVQGPILLVYPDGTWYHSATPETIEKIIQEHLIGNKIVTEYLFHQHPLSIPTIEEISR